MIKIEEMNNDQFRICMETISRMGVKGQLEDPTNKESRRIFYQSCYAIKIRGEFYIASWKEILNKKMEPKDIAQLNTVTMLLEKWNLLKIKEKEAQSIDEYGTVPRVGIVPFKDKHLYVKRNSLSSKHLANFIQIQIKKIEVETAMQEKTKNIKN